MAKIVPMEPLTAGYVAITDSRRKEPVGVCSDGLSDLLQYIRHCITPNGRANQERLLAQDEPFQPYLKKLALDNTKVGESPEPLVNQIYETMKASMSR